MCLGFGTSPPQGRDLGADSSLQLGGAGFAAPGEHVAAQAPARHETGVADLLDGEHRPKAFTAITKSLSPAARRIILAARDPHLSPALRLRHATVFAQPFADLDGDAERIRRRAVSDDTRMSPGTTRFVTDNDTGCHR